MLLIWHGLLYDTLRYTLAVSDCCFLMPAVDVSLNTLSGKQRLMLPLHDFPSSHAFTFFRLPEMVIFGESELVRRQKTLLVYRDDLHFLPSSSVKYCFVHSFMKAIHFMMHLTHACWVVLFFVPDSSYHLGFPGDVMLKATLRINLNT